jgi:hypothetical protein
VEKFKISNDPKFADKVRDVVGLYLDPPDRALVLCADEKSQIQCGIYFDVDPPYALEMIDIESGKRTKIRSSRCKMERGDTGWISSETIR